MYERTRLNVRIGTAGWTIPNQHAALFVGEGSHLERYARQLPAVEINSSFYRPHRHATYVRWSAGVPAGFRFAVKMPREITHERRLLDIEAPLDRFLGEAAGLGDKLGPLLVQLPPRFQYDGGLMGRFWTTLRARHAGWVACEPRHYTWFADPVDDQFAQFHVARVAADPAVVPRAAELGGWPGLIYWRLHGTPKTYYSTYAPDFMSEIAGQIAAHPANTERWCIFDNTALGEAAANALELKRLCS